MRYNEILIKSSHLVAKLHTPPMRLLSPKQKFTNIALRKLKNINNAMATRQEVVLLWEID